ncbi:hypothetical protein THOESC006_P10840 (plasmid) [Escherichia coli]|nr:hypothetical protein THOESC006_P10840 [Escherichia coli]
MPHAAKVLKQVMVNTEGTKGRSPQNVKTAAPETQQMMGAENINRRRYIMAVRGINKVILVGRLGKDPEVRYIPNGGAVANLQVATSESWRDKQTGRCGRQNGIAWCCSASSRKWLANICARACRSTSKVSFAPVAGNITVSPVTSPKFLLRPRHHADAGRAAGAQTQPEEGNSSAVSLSRNHRRRPVRKKVRKNERPWTKGRAAGASAATAGG